MPTGISSTAEKVNGGGRFGEAEREQTVAEQGQTGEVTLRALFEGLEVCSGLPEREMRIRQIVNDSRKVQADALFVAIHGVATDGNLYAKDAATRGAAVILSANPKPADWSSKAAWVEVAEPRKALAIAGANFFGRPAKALKLVGVTGTNGKTTTSSLVDS